MRAQSKPHDKTFSNTQEETQHNTTPGIHVNRSLDPFQMHGSQGFQGRRDTLSTPPFNRTSYFSKKHTHFCRF